MQRAIPCGYVLPLIPLKYALLRHVAFWNSNRVVIDTREQWQYHEVTRKNDESVSFVRPLSPWAVMVLFQDGLLELVEGGMSEKQGT